MTPDREAEIRAALRDPRSSRIGTECTCVPCPVPLNMTQDLLAALDAEREARERAERERDEARRAHDDLLHEGTADAVVSLSSTVDRLTRERDEARALPVIRTCVDCGWLEITAVRGGLDGQTYECVAEADIPRSVDWKRAPPEWCPLRGGSR